MVTNHQRAEKTYGPFTLRHLCEVRDATLRHRDLYLGYGWQDSVREVTIQLAEIDVVLDRKYRENPDLDNPPEPG